MPTLNPTELRAGTAIVLNGEPTAVLKYEHVKMGRGGATVRVKVRNLKSGAIYEKTFRGNEKAEAADMARAKVNFLYRQGNQFAFMDQATFEQYELPAEVVGDTAKWLTDGQELDVLLFDGQPIGVQLPIKLEFEVTETEPGVRGNTVSNVLKPATISSGTTVQVPLFVKTGDRIRVNTEEGTYAERA